MPIYNQRDPQWNGVTLGTGPGTIGMWGCYLTAYAQVLSDFGFVIDPPGLNALIPYVDGNELTDHAVDGLFGGAVKTINIWDFRNSPANLGMINDSDPSTRFIIEVDFDHDPSDGIQTHFVTEASWNGTDLMINDPWYGTTDNFALHYGIDLATTIIKVVELQGPVPAPAPAPAEANPLPPPEPSTIPDPVSSPEPVVPVPGSVVLPEPAPSAPAEPSPAPETPAPVVESQPAIEPPAQPLPVPTPDLPATQIDEPSAPPIDPKPSITMGPEQPIIAHMNNKYTSRKFLLTVATAIATVVLYVIGAVNGGEALTSITFLTGLYQIVQGQIDHANVQ